MGFLDSMGDIFAGQASGTDARSLMENQQAFTQKQMQMRHQWEVNDLEAAGLNPILSAHGTPSTGSSGSASQFTSGQNDITTAKQMRQIDQQTKQIKSQEDLNRAVASKTNEEHRRASAEADKARVEADIAQQTYNVKYGGDKAEKRISATTEDYPSVIKGPARDLALSIKRAKEKVKSSNSAKGLGEALKKFKTWLKTEAEPKMNRLSPKKVNKNLKGYRVRSYDKNKSYRGTNKKKADSYREYLKKNPRN